jgi:CDP-diacylglycerol---serine O-phosphatidyltransferase
MADTEHPSDEEAQLTSSGRLKRLEQFGGTSNPARSVRRRRQRMPGLALLPTALTLGNAVCGIAALIELAKAYGATQTGDPGEAIVRLAYAALLIGAGTLFDALDGKVARMTGTAGEFGAQLDSLCDVVTFGVVPALLLRVGGELFYAGGPYAVGNDSQVLWAIAALYTCCAVMRLARYNVETIEADEHKTFMGLPSPAAAASVAGIVLGASWFAQEYEWFAEQPWPWILRVVFPALGAGIALLMVSRIRYLHLFNRLVSRRQSLRMMVALLAVATVGYILIEYWKLMVPLLMLSYVLSGPGYLGWRMLRGRGLLGRRQALAERKRRRHEEIKGKA